MIRSSKVKLTSQIKVTVCNQSSPVLIVLLTKIGAMLTKPTTFSGKIRPQYAYLSVAGLCGRTHCREDCVFPFGEPKSIRNLKRKLGGLSGNPHLPQKYCIFEYNFNISRRKYCVFNRKYIVLEYLLAKSVEMCVRESS